MRKSEWANINVVPDYDGEYEVDDGHRVMPAVFRDGKWQSENDSLQRWRGRATRLSAAEKLALKVKLDKRCELGSARQEAASAAVDLARAAQERVARAGGTAGLKTGVRLFHIAISLGASLQRRDAEFMENVWPKLKPEPKKKVEEQARRFIAGEIVKIS